MKKYKDYEYLVDCIVTDPDRGKYHVEMPIRATTQQSAVNKAIKQIYVEYGQRAYLHRIYNND